MDELTKGNAMEGQQPTQVIGSLPSLSVGHLPDTLSAREVTRIVALEIHVAFLEDEVRESRERLSHLEFQHRAAERDLRRERTANRRLRTEFKRLVRWLDQIQEQIGRLYGTRRWKAASILSKSTGFPGLDVLIARYQSWKKHRPSGMGLDGRIDPYANWLLEQRPNAQHRVVQKAQIEHMASKPTFGLVLDLRDNPNPEGLLTTVDSLCSQTFEDWKLFILARDRTAVRVSSKDTRVVVFEDDALPVGVSHLAGIGVGDTLESHALTRIALSFEDRILTADLVYTDEDERDTLGLLGNPFLKPHWSPDTLESSHYTGALAVYRTSVLEERGLRLSALTPARAYDTVLRVSETTDFRAVHIPEVLFHRLKGDVESRIRLADIELEALATALNRRACQAEVHHGAAPGLFHVRRRILREERTTIFIPTRDRLSLLKRCIETLTLKTAYKNYDITIINNESREPETLAFLAACGHRVFNFPGPFNYAAMHNAAVAASDSPWLLLLNNDTEVIEPHWLHVMAEHVQRPEVGAVGAKLLFPDGTIQHAGVVLGIQQRAAHAFAGVNPGSLTSRGQLQMVRNYSAVTAACMMMRREVYERLGGFDAERFPIAYNDVELCVRALKLGYRNVYTPLAVLKHHECASRPRRDNPREVENLHQACFGPHGWTDPFYHPSLNQESADFTVDLR